MVGSSDKRIVNEMTRPGHGCKEGTLNEKQKP